MYRQKGKETPSDQGLTKEARERLEYRKQQQRRFEPRGRRDWERTPTGPVRNPTPLVRNTGTVRRVGGVGNWDAETPFIAQSLDAPRGIDETDWNDNQQQLDRDWYNLEENMQNEHAMDEFAGYAKQKEEETQKKTRITARQLQFNKDNDLWERNRMLQSGIVQRSAVDTDFDDDNEVRVHLMVRDLKPPFLEGKTVSNQVDVVQVLRDPTGDMASCALKGSRVVAEKREQRERAKVSLLI
jgi:pre-mRNA-splicing factor ATP-dependent RNA helicase DHX38/PRP16